MNTKNSISGLLVGLSGVLTMATTVASADITTEQRIAVQGVGLMAAGNMSGTTKMAISGNRSRSDSDLQFESKLVRMFARGAAGATADIILLDADKLYHVNLNKKEYTEQTFEELRTRMQQGLQDAGKDDEQRQQPGAVDESKCDWLPPKTDVRKTGEKGTFAGYDADRVIITAEQPCKDRDTGTICEIALTLDEWMAPRFATNEEVQKYHKAYAQKMGLDSVTLGADATERAKAIFSRYKGAWTEVAGKMRDVKGYPVKSSFSLAVGGDACQSARNPQEPQSTDHSPTTSPADIAGKVGARLGSLFRKKKDDSAASDSSQSAASTAAAAPTAGPAGTTTLMTVITEIVSISTAAIPATAFEVPVGFKKVEAGDKGPS